MKPAVTSCHERCAAVWQAEDAVKAAAGREGIGAVERGLLLGKVFAQWRGHTKDAIATYDDLIKARPNAIC